MLIDLVVPFAASFALVALRAFQQRNVQFARYGAMFGTTIMYAFAEAAVVLAYVGNGNGFNLPAVLAIGLGGATGGVLAVKVSKRIFHD